MVADNALERNGSELSIKTGRKALLVGVPCKAFSERGAQEPCSASILQDMETFIEKGLKGDFSGKLDESALEEPWRPLAKALNDTQRRLEEESLEVSRLRTLEGTIKDKESQAADLAIFRESILFKNPMPVLLVDPSQQVVDANEAFSRVSGITRDQVREMNFQDFKTISSRGGGLSDVQKFKRYNVSDIILELPSGLHAFEQYGIPLVDSEGTILGILVVLYDKTSTVQDEEQMKSEIQELKILLEEEKKSKESPVTAADTRDDILPAGSPEAVAVEQSNSPVISDPVPVQVKKEEKKEEKTLTYDVVEFELSGEKYALDINLAREIVEMMPITPIPCSPEYLRGIMNLRGEITNIINITTILGLPPLNENGGSKIIVLSAEATGGENIGVIVDDVQSVIQINERDVERIGEGLSAHSSMNIKGIIKIGSKTTDKKTGTQEKDLVIWLDMLKVIEDLSIQKVH